VSDYPPTLKPGMRPKRAQNVYICRRCSARWNGGTGTRLSDSKEYAIVGQIPDCPMCRGEEYEYDG
jgi:hypothetical protein